MWLSRLSHFEDTSYWANSFSRENPEFSGNFEVYQWNNVFLGGEDDLEEAQAKAGQPICKTVDCRDLPELSAEQPEWDYETFSKIQEQFNKKVEYVVSLIHSVNCPIFVYCAAGINRSVSVLAAAIAQVTGESLDSILSDMKQSRFIIAPQDPYYLMALDQSPSESPEFKEKRFQELDQDFPLMQPGLPTTAQIEPVSDFPEDLAQDINVLHDEKEWHRAVGTSGSLVKHDKEGWIGKVIELRGDPVNGGKVLVEHEFEGRPAQKFYSALELSPVMQITPPVQKKWHIAVTAPDSLEEHTVVHKALKEKLWNGEYKTHYDLPICSPMVLSHGDSFVDDWNLVTCKRCLRMQNPSPFRRASNWLQKTATKFEVFKWQNYTKKAIESFVQGEWDQYGYAAADYGDINRVAFIGKDVMIKPNSLFYVVVEMKRRPGIRVMDSEHGNKDIVFSCRIKASSHQKWPSFGEVIGQNEMLNTPYEIAKFVEETVENYYPKDGDGDGDGSDDDPNMFPDWPYGEEEYTQEETTEDMMSLRNPRIRGNRML